MINDEIFAFTLKTKKDCFEKGDCIFSTGGDVLGKIINKHKNDIDKENLYYSYDVESLQENYKKLFSGEMKVYSLEKYSVSECSTYYHHK